MAGFVGYIVHQAGIHFPWKMPGDEVFSSGSFSAPDVWDSIPDAAKAQIILAVGIFEVYSEHSFILEKQGQKHYMRGGKAGYFPALDNFPHPVPFNLWDPFGFTKGHSAEKKASGLIKEINNGRLAMIGLMGLLSASKGAIVPGINELDIPQYSGEVMAPFSTSFFPSVF